MLQHNVTSEILQYSVIYQIDNIQLHTRFVSHKAHMTPCTEQPPQKPIQQYLVSNHLNNKVTK